MTWSVGKLAAAMYPLGAGAMAVNSFMASLIGSWIGLPVLSTSQSIVVGGVVAAPLTLWFARYIRGLMDEAD